MTPGRLGKAYWVQTPSGKFPIEPHTGIPFYWKLPQKIRKKMIKKWEVTLPGWTEMVKGTVLVTEQEMKKFFPESKIFYERKFLIFEKSYSFFKEYH